MSFIHLHLHTEYSLLDGVQKVMQVIEKTKELGMTSVALTDHGSLYGLYEFWHGCHDFGIKPIIGDELYVVQGSRHDKVAGMKTFHLPIFAKTLDGYHNLVKLVSIGHLEGFYYKPRVDKELLEKYSKDIIVLSGSKFGELRSNIELGNLEEAKEVVKYYKNLYGENYFIELTPDLKENEGEHELKVLLDLAKEFDVKTVATANSYYMKKEDSLIQEIVWAIADGKKLSDPSRRKNSSSQYFRTEEEMRALWADMPEVVDRTQEIADSVEEYNIGYGKVEPACVDIPEGKTAKEWVRELAFAGMKEKYSKNDEKYKKKVEDRLEYELNIIDMKGYNNYFLVVREYVLWSNAQGIPTSCRGSGASSLVAYCIGITPLDPVRWNLPFERLLNPERASFPDFDIDFADDKRELVFEHMKEKYGNDFTCNICAIGRMKSRAVMKDVGRVMDVPLGITDKLSKMVTVKFGKPASLKEMMDKELHPDFAEEVAKSDELKELVRISSTIENNARHISTHACGFIYVPMNVSDLIPIQRETRGDRRVISMIEGVKMEELGLMKFDFLGVANLTTIAITVNLVRERHGVELKMRQIPEDDKPTFELLKKADTNGVFQFESDGMKKYMKNLKPSKVEDLSFMVAAYRPGPMEFIDPYIRRKHGKEEVTYPHDVLIPVLEETYGYAIYQEQIMQIAQTFAGYTLGAADMLRRAMGKKKVEIMAQEKVNFIAGAIKMGHTQEEAEVIFSYMEPFANYGFNKAHSAAYAMISYQTAFLKANYTIEFIAALMQTDIEKPDKLIRDIEEAKAHGIEVLPPDVNESNEDFTIVDDTKIRFGLAGLKGVGRAQISEIVQKRKEKGQFTSLADLLESIDLTKVSKSCLELMAKVGALERFGNRAQILQAIPSAIDSVHKFEKQKAQGQFDLFGGGGSTESHAQIDIPNVEEVSSMQKMEWEREILGIFLSEHPLLRYEEMFKRRKVTFSKDLPEKRGRSKVKVVAIISSIREIRTKAESKLMCFGKIEDAYGAIPIVVFPKTYANEGIKEKLKAGNIVSINGSVDKKEEISIMVDTVKVLTEDELKGTVVENIFGDDPAEESKGPEFDAFGNANDYNNRGMEMSQEDLQNETQKVYEMNVPTTTSAQAVEPVAMTSNGIKMPPKFSFDGRETKPTVQQSAPAITPSPAPVQEIKRENIVSTVKKVVLHLDPGTIRDKLVELANFFKLNEGNTNIELYLSDNKRVVLKNGIRYDDIFKRKVSSIVPIVQIEEIN